MIYKGFVLVAVLTLQVTSNTIKNPRDLADQAREQLNELQSIVQGEILLAHSELEELEYDFLAHGNNLMSEATISIQQEQETIQQQINTIKELAQGSNKDISACTDIREELLGRLPAQYDDQLKSCIFEKNVEEAGVVLNARYIIDVSINKVHNIEFQLRVCRGDILCISPLLNEIQLDKIRLPQNIRTEVNAVEAILSTLTLSVNQCSDSAVSEYIGDASAIFDDLTDCVNAILG